MDEFLQSLRINQEDRNRYIQSLKNGGIDVTLNIQNLSQQQKSNICQLLNKCDVKPGHLKRIVKTLQEGDIPSTVQEDGVLNEKTVTMMLSHPDNDQTISNLKPIKFDSSATAATVSAKRFPVLDGLKSPFIKQLPSDNFRLFDELKFKKNNNLRFSDSE